MNIPNTLYHYTSLDKAFKIITGKNIWLTSSEHLNDPKENSHFLKHINIIEDIFPINEYPELHRSLNRKRHSLYVPFLFSMSNLEDDLGQWRAYGSNTQGISLCFDWNKLETKILEIVEMEPVPTLSMSEVIYV